MSLDKYIKSYGGNPDAVIFSFETNEYYAIWGYDDTISINANDITKDSLDDLQEKLDCWKKISTEVAAVGYFSYDSKNIFFPKLNFKATESDMPIIWFGKPKNIQLIKRKDFLPSQESNLNKRKSIDGLKKYGKVISKIKDYLRAGDVYQVNYTLPAEYRLESDCEFELFLQLFKSAQPDFGAYIKLNGHHILSLSPENFFTKINSSISSFPIKGTRPVSKNSIQNQILRDELENSIKDRAEHVMIVDLVRNDLGKICEYGSVETINLFNVVSYETIHHMVTEIKGNLRVDINEINIFRALFPGGSITGAPKQRAIEIIAEIEAYSRGIYTGSIGLISASGNMIFNIAIRTLTLKDSWGVYPVGGGIVWDSEASEERKEALDKSRVLD